MGVSEGLQGSDVTLSSLASSVFLAAVGSHIILLLLQGGRLQLLWPVCRLSTIHYSCDKHVARYKRVRVSC